MDQRKASEKRGAGMTERVSPVYVPPLQLTKGQPPPITANGGVSYMALDRGRNAGTGTAAASRCRELLTKNLRNFGCGQHYTEARADAKVARRFMSINRATPMETARQAPFVLRAWPSFADQSHVALYPTTALARPPAALTARTTSGTGSPSSPRQFRCASVPTRSPTSPSRTGLFTRPASTLPYRPTRCAVRTSWSDPLPFSKQPRRHSRDSAYEDPCC